MKKIFKVCIVLLLGGMLIGCASMVYNRSNYIDYDPDLPSGKTAIVSVPSFVIRNYNGIPLERGLRLTSGYILPLGSAKLGFKLFTKTWDDEVEFEVNLTEGVDWEAQVGQYYELWLRTPEDGIWGVDVWLKDIKTKKGEKIAFAPIVKDGQLIVGKKYKPEE